MTAPVVELAAAAFFEGRRADSGIDLVLEACMADGVPFEVALRDDRIVMAASAPAGAEHGRTDVWLQGRWRSPYLRSTPHEAGALLLLPFLAWIEGLSFAPAALVTLGRGDRSVADMVMRNFAAAALRGARCDVSLVTADAAARVAASSKTLAKTYLWIMRSMLTDPILAVPNGPELILARAHLAGPEFTDPLLAEGVRSYRQAAAAREADGRSADRQLFLAQREQWIQRFRD